jgi:hypothetical protein
MTEQQLENRHQMAVPLHGIYVALVQNTGCLKHITSKSILIILSDLGSGYEID